MIKNTTKCIRRKTDAVVRIRNYNSLVDQSKIPPLTSPQRDTIAYVLSPYVDLQNAKVLAKALYLNIFSLVTTTDTKYLKFINEAVDKNLLRNIIETELVKYSPQNLIFLLERTKNYYSNKNIFAKILRDIGDNLEFNFDEFSTQQIQQIFLLGLQPKRMATLQYSIQDKSIALAKGLIKAQVQPYIMVDNIIKHLEPQLLKEFISQVCYNIEEIDISIFNEQHSVKEVNVYEMIKTKAKVTAVAEGLIKAQAQLKSINGLELIIQCLKPQLLEEFIGKVCSNLKEIDIIKFTDQYFLEEVNVYETTKAKFTAVAEGLIKAQAQLKSINGSELIIQYLEPQLLEELASKVFCCLEEIDIYYIESEQAIALAEGLIKSKVQPKSINGLEIIKYLAPQLLEEFISKVCGNLEEIESSSINDLNRHQAIALVKGLIKSKVQPQNMHDLENIIQYLNFELLEEFAKKVCPNLEKIDASNITTAEQATVLAQVLILSGAKPKIIDGLENIFQYLDSELLEEFAVKSCCNLEEIDANNIQTAEQAIVLAKYLCVSNAKPTLIYALENIFQHLSPQLLEEFSINVCSNLEEIYIVDIDTKKQAVALVKGLIKSQVMPKIINGLEKVIQYLTPKLFKQFAIKVCSDLEEIDAYGINTKEQAINLTEFLSVAKAKPKKIHGLINIIEYLDRKLQQQLFNDVCINLKEIFAYDIEGKKFAIILCKFILNSRLNIKSIDGLLNIIMHCSPRRIYTFVSKACTNLDEINIYSSLAEDQVIALAKGLIKSGIRPKSIYGLENIIQCLKPELLKEFMSTVCSSIQELDAHSINKAQQAIYLAKVLIENNIKLKIIEVESIIKYLDPELQQEFISKVCLNLNRLEFT